jgi:hypothetical protein
VKKYRNLVKIYSDDLKFILNGTEVPHNSCMSLAELHISEWQRIEVVQYGHLPVGGGIPKKEINIKFIKIPNIINIKKNSNDLIGLLKLCLLKEISPKLNNSQIDSLSMIISYIMRILKNGYIEDDDDIKKNIKEVLNKIRGSNIINFSKYVDKIINSNELNKILNLLNKEELNEILDIKYRLSKYNDIIKVFDKEFEEAKKLSFFEFSVISLVVIEREDYETFEKERQKCPYRVDKILFHGTSIEPISCILTGYFRKSVERCYQHGKGVYFTDLLDYCWFYGGEKNNRANTNKIPGIGETFTLIACSVYYDNNGFRIVSDHKYTPKKNEINFAYAGAELETLTNLDNTKFYGTEYVIWELDQICPFMSMKLKRNEYCVIWRDDNFSSKPIYNNEFDKIFKDFLQERMKYIEEDAKFNIYTFDNSEDALKLVERKKYNKIILISNVGKNLIGKDFINRARKIIGNDVIALFLAYKESHLEWIVNYKNALFSNQSNFYEKYLECFSDEYDINARIYELKESIEKHYNVNFNFDDKFLDFPLYKVDGKYSDLTFSEID